MYVFDDFLMNEQYNDDNTYYFNVLLTHISLNVRNAQYILPNGLDKMWDLSQVTDLYPQAYLFSVDTTLDPDTEFEVYRDPHQIVMVSADNQVSTMDMIDFQTEDPWEITIEDLYENEDEDWEDEP